MSLAYMDLYGYLYEQKTVISMDLYRFIWICMVIYMVTKNMKLVKNGEKSMVIYGFN